MKKVLLSAALLACCLTSFADEGMWMVNSLSRALVQKMQSEGLELSANEIYNEEAVALSDAIVALDFGCSGSLISDRGLLITNHHCAYSDVHSLSTPQKNYLEDGFWAFREDEEIYIPGKSIYFLKRVLDLTDEVNRTIKEETEAGRAAGMRRISYLIEKKYKEETGLEASLSTMWAGEKYYLALYQVYTDIRLVAAPPVSIAAFGGDIDNWEWPQHKCDFALYRIYGDPDGNPAPHSDKNVPFTPSNHLKISTAGVKPGDFTMIMGYPGKTDRYSSSAKVAYKQEVALPISNKVRGEQMEIIKRWMDADPDIRLKYSDKFFSLSNVQELNAGEVECYGRFGVVREKKREEKKLKGAENTALLQLLDEKYTSIRDAEKNMIYFRETMVRGPKLALIATRLKNHSKGFTYEKEYSDIDMRVEKDLFFHAVRTFYENVDSTMWGDFQKAVRARFVGEDGKCDYDALCTCLWTDDYITENDDIFKFLTDISVAKFNQAIDLIQGPVTVSALGKEYTRALYRSREERSVLQAPDANSTMRLTFGKVGTFRRDGRKLPWQTLSGEILAKEDTTSYDFTLKNDWRGLLSGSSVPVNFITGCDITGGNSGSPVLNGKGELVGLAFDGNKESLASDASYTPIYNKCVCVDIRFVLWTLENYAHLDRILEEIGA